MLIRFGLFLIWVIHFLPFRIIFLLGKLFGKTLYYLGRERRRVAQLNLTWCFPTWDQTKRTQLIQQQFEHFACALLARGVQWHASPARLKTLIRFKNKAILEHALAQHEKIILLAPHFVGLDMAWTRLTLEPELSMISMYSNQKNPVFNQAMLTGRLRFNHAELVSRQEGILPVIKAIKNNKIFYYLPDLDYGKKEAVFVPFFEKTAATITALSRLAKVTKAVVIPCITTQSASGYEVEFFPAWDKNCFPSDDLVADTTWMNQFIETRIATMPEQYFWLHKRFKSRPDGEKNPYNI